MSKLHSSAKTANTNRRAPPVTYRRTAQSFPVANSDAGPPPPALQTGVSGAERPRKAAPTPKPRLTLFGVSVPHLETRPLWRRPSSRNIAVLAAVAAGALLVSYLNVFGGGLSAHFAKANGRVEAQRIDVATKCPGKLNEVLVAEGDYVTAGQALARMDAAEVEAQMLETEAGLRQSKRLLDQAAAFLAQRTNEQGLAEKQLERAEALRRQGYATEEILDARRSASTSARAAVEAANAQVSVTQAGVDASAARLARIKSLVGDCEVKAPGAGRVQHRIASPGEVLPAGARIVTLLDVASVHMTVFLPMAETGRLSINSDARLVLDAAPDYVIPAYVSFIATEAQFTPKYVETKSEREKLMFRIKVQVPKDLLAQHPDLVKAGVPGEAYLKLDAETPWPGWLEAKLPPAPAFAAAVELREPPVSEHSKGPLLSEYRPEQ